MERTGGGLEIGNSLLLSHLPLGQPALAAKGFLLSPGRYSLIVQFLFGLLVLLGEAPLLLGVEWWRRFAGGEELCLDRLKAALCGMETVETRRQLRLNSTAARQKALLLPQSNRLLAGGSATAASHQGQRQQHHQLRA